jgi:hypothetical protein
MLAAQFSPQFAVVCAPPPRLATGIILYVTLLMPWEILRTHFIFHWTKYFSYNHRVFFNKFCVINKKIVNIFDFLARWLGKSARYNGRGFILRSGKIQSISAVLYSKTFKHTLLLKKSPAHFKN